MKTVVRRSPKQGLRVELFAWTKPAKAIIESRRKMLKRISTAVL